jgi:hypothetical protein
VKKSTFYDFHEKPRFFDFSGFAEMAFLQSSKNAFCGFAVCAKLDKADYLTPLNPARIAIV